MKDFIKRLSSRKFLVTIALVVVLTLFPDVPDAVISLALAYIGAEGLTDVVRAYRQADVAKSQVDKDIAMISNGLDPDNPAGSNMVVPGK